MSTIPNWPNKHIDYVGLQNPIFSTDVTIANNNVLLALASILNLSNTDFAIISGFVYAAAEYSAGIVYINGNFYASAAPIAENLYIDYSTSTTLSKVFKDSTVHDTYTLYGCTGTATANSFPQLVGNMDQYRFSLMDLKRFSKSAQILSNNFTNSNESTILNTTLPASLTASDAYFSGLRVDSMTDHPVFVSCDVITNNRDNKLFQIAMSANGIIPSMISWRAANLYTNAWEDWIYPATSLNIASLQTQLANLYTKVINIGGWNMNVDSIKTVAHGLTLSKIRSVDVNIVNDDGSKLTSLLTNYGGTLYSETTGSYLIDSANINLNCLASFSTFYNTNPLYSGVIVNRGFVVIKYIL